MPDMVEKIRTVKFYLGSKGNGSQYYVIDCKGRTLHDYLFEHRPGYEIDHINLDTFDNRRCNIRYCTHQQNQMNQPLQKNNTSGVSGVSYYPPRRKFRARIKICQQEIHLGYFGTFEDAVKARNIGMLCMFGQYGRYNDTGKAPDWMKEKSLENVRVMRNSRRTAAFLISGMGVLSMLHDKLTLGSLFDGSGGFPRAACSPALPRLGIGD